MYVAIDANIELSEEDGVMDVFGYVKKMRTQRRGLVESLVSRTTIIVARLEIIPHLVRLVSNRVYLAKWKTTMSVKRSMKD